MNQTQRVEPVGCASRLAVEDQVYFFAHIEIHP